MQSRQAGDRRLDLPPTSTLQGSILNTLCVLSRPRPPFSSHDILMSVEIQNLGPSTPFPDEHAEEGGSTTSNLIHIRCQQRNGRKFITTIEGLANSYDLKKISRALKKELNCNGTIINHEDYGNVIQLQGDQRQKVKEFLLETDICFADQIRMHGA